MEDAPSEVPIGPKIELRVSVSPVHGLGVFAAQAVKPGQVIEICPTIVVPPAQVEAIDQTIIREYVYPWEDGYIAVLGYGMIYNHAVESNARYFSMRQPQSGVVVQVYASVQPIEPDEEIFVNYAGARGFTGRLWFQDD